MASGAIPNYVFRTMGRAKKSPVKDVSADIKRFIDAGGEIQQIQSGQDLPSMRVGTHRTRQ